MATYKDASELHAEARRAANHLADLVDILGDLVEDDPDAQADLDAAKSFLDTAKCAQGL